MTINGNISKCRLDLLIIRDKNICHICNKECDPNDYEIKNGVFYVGNFYPSRDHVIPRSKGGKNDLSNVKLAHFICNSKKSNKI